jgi:hypothetical protein
MLVHHLCEEVVQVVHIGSPARFELSSRRHALKSAVTEAEGPRFVSLHDESLYQPADITGACTAGSSP